MVMGYISLTGNADAHMPRHSANLWAKRPTKWWNEDKELAATALFRAPDPSSPATVSAARPAPPATTRCVTSPCVSTRVSSAATSTVRAASATDTIVPDVDEPADPRSLHIGYKERVARMERTLTKLHHGSPTAEKRRMWNELGWNLCEEGNYWSFQTGAIFAGCERVQIHGSPFCDYHTCKAITCDGERCLNLVSTPLVTRICTSGMHVENNREQEVLDLIHNRQMLNQQEAEAKRLAFELQQAPADSLPPLAIYTDTPNDAGTSRSSITASPSGSTSTSIGLQTPVTPKSGLYPEVDTWWKGEWKAVDWTKSDSGCLRRPSSNVDHVNAVSGSGSGVGLGLGLRIHIEDTIDEEASVSAGLTTGSPRISTGIVAPQSGTSPRVQVQVDEEDEGLVIDVKKMSERRKGKMRAISQDREGGSSKMAQIMSTRFGNGTLRGNTFRRDQGSQPFSQ